MNNIQQLIQQLCPNGVEYKRLGEVCERLRGTSITAKKMKEIASPNGEIKIFAGGKTIINAQEEDIPNANITRVPAVLVQSRGVIDVVFYDKPFTFKNEMWAYAANNSDACIVKFLYYVLKTTIPSLRKIASIRGSLPQISLRDTDNLLIPLPPLPVQRAVAAVLDRFTQLETQLETELETELQCRKKQYEYYRDSLLNFDNDNVQWVKLGECLGYEQPGKYIVSSKDYVDKGTPVLTAGQTFILGYTDEKDGIYKASKDNPVIIFDDFTTSFHWVTFDFKVKSSAMKMLKPKDNGLELNFRYLYYAMKCIMYEATEHSRQWISKYSMFEIPLPSLSVQRRIVGILDRFEALTTSISEGLPAEIEARRRQYEYYRDRLLTFKRKEQ